MSTPTPGGDESAVLQALRSQASSFSKVAWFSLTTSLLVLVPTWFMLEVYDRVVNSRNERTLWMLFLAVLLAYAVMEAIDLIRSRILHAVGEAVDERLRNRLFEAAFTATLRRQSSGSTQAFTDLRTLREFLPSGAATALFDAPASIVFLILVYVISPWLGTMTLIGGLVQLAIAWSTEKRTMPLLTEANKASIEAQNYANSTLRNAQVIESMGMLGDIHRRWAERQGRTLLAQAQASDHAGLNATASRQIQLMLGSLILGASCWLELNGNLVGGGGMMIVASVLGGRVLQPLAQIVAQWRAVVNVRDAVRRLDRLLALAPETEPAMPLPAPKGLLTVEGLVAGAPGSQTPIIKGVTFGVRPGEVVAVIGPSASGKTTLARLLVGLWPAASGKVRLDGADVFAWNKAELGPHVGYLPQNVELFDGTIAENIARFGPSDRAGVEAAATLAGMQSWVASLPDGLDTRVGEDGATLSGGQRQRVGLARAVFGNPQFLVLDEPNASLDDAGEQALVQMLLQLRQRGATVLVVTHRTSVLPACDKLLVLRDGQVAGFGPRDEVLAQIKAAAEQAMAANTGATQTRPAAVAPTSLPGRPVMGGAT
jgi:ATP-binding cassette, subfamily C, bacterial exporter for protease/lipase